MKRWATAIFLVLVAGLAISVAVVWTKLPEIAADWASRATGRAVRIGTLRLSPGRWVHVEMRDASVANLPGGTRPAMATVGTVTGDVALWPLLHGSVVARDVRIGGADLLLEKVEGQPNWRDGPKRPAQPGDGRAGFPTLLGVTIDGVVTFRTSSGHPLVTRLDGVRIEAASPSAPARISGPAAYQDVPIALDLALGSYDQLHDADKPFPTDIRMTSGDTVLRFVGTMTDPLNVDGADGTLSIVAPTPAVLEKVSGAAPSPAPSLRLEGVLERDHELWKLQQAKGALGDAAVESGTLQLRSGSSETKTPDKVDVTLRFGEVDADRLQAAFDGGGDPGGQSSFVPQAAPDPLIRAALEAAGLTYGNSKLAEPKLMLTVGPNETSFREVSFGALGGHVQLDGRVRTDADGKTGAASATLAATGLAVSDLSQVLGAGRLPLSGRVDVHAVAEGAGRTPTAALDDGRASVVATMSGGSVSLRLVELASTDVSGFLRSSRQMVPLACVLAVAELRGGVASVGPARLRSAQGTITARGQVNLLRNTLDVVVASEARTTGALALDVPVRVSGRVDDPTIAPSSGAAGRSALSDGLPAGLDGSLRTQAERSPCAR